MNEMNCTVLYFTVLYAEHEIDGLLRRDKGPDEDLTRFTFGSHHAVAMPFLSSAALLLLFFFFNYIQTILFFVICTTSGVGLAFVCQPFMELLSKPFPWLKRPVVTLSPLGLPTALLVRDVYLYIGVLITLFGWLFTGSFLLSNALGIGLCVLMVSVVNVPNLKVCTILLTLLFFYDIFWVFFSASIFGSNVMVDAATQQAGNPAKYLLTDVLHFPAAAIPSHLEMPMKLVVPWNLETWSDDSSSGEFLMLGLGDIGLPGMLLAYLLSAECATKVKVTTTCLANDFRGIFRVFMKSSYVFQCWVGYIVGLVCTLLAGMVFHSPQPALLFLVPCMLTPLFLKAHSNGDLQRLWEGNPHEFSDTV